MWLAAALAPPLLTRNPFYLAGALAAVGVVYGVVARGREAVAGWGAFLRLGLVLVAFSALVQPLLVHVGATTLFTLPSWSWHLDAFGRTLGTVELGGRVTLESVVYGIGRGLALLAVLLAFATFNARVDPYHLLRGIPRFLYQSGIVLSIALAFVPQMLAAQREIREAQALRGHRFRGLRDLVPLLVALLAEGLERSIDLAESMEARGFGYAGGADGEATSGAAARRQPSAGASAIRRPDPGDDLRPRHQRRPCRGARPAPSRRLGARLSPSSHHRLGGAGRRPPPPRRRPRRGRPPGAAEPLPPRALAAAGHRPRPLLGRRPRHLCRGVGARPSVTGLLPLPPARPAPVPPGARSGAGPAYRAGRSRGISTRRRADARGSLMPPAPVDPVIELTGVTYRYPAGGAGAAGAAGAVGATGTATGRPALADFDLIVAAGERLVVAGASGSGKSTFLRCLNGLVPHFHGGTICGRVRVAGRDPVAVGPRGMSDAVGLVFQDPERQLITARVEDELAFAMENHDLPRAVMGERIAETLDRLGIAHLRRRRVDTLSGGERQRVAIASVLTLRPAILALDEPTSQLDPPAAAEVLALLADLNREAGLTVLVGEHRLERVAAWAGRVCHLPGPGLPPVTGPPREVLAASALAPPLTRLAAAVGVSPAPLAVEEAAELAARLRERLGGPAGGPTAAAGASRGAPRDRSELRARHRSRLGTRALAHRRPPQPARSPPASRPSRLAASPSRYGDREVLHDVELRRRRAASGWSWSG